MSANPPSLSPLHYKELEESFDDANFKVDISQKMKVPNKLSFNDNGAPHSNWTENIDMQVPDRILAMGHQQFIGSRGAPREIDFDHSLMASEPYPTDLRVATPPRTLTLDRYPFPGVDDDFNDHDDDETVVNKIPVVNARSNKKLNMDDSDLQLSLRDNGNTPHIGRHAGGNLSVTEEVPHLRKQLAKLNRRVMALESENLNRMAREKIIYGIGIAYFLLKTIIWLNRSS